MFNLQQLIDELSCDTSENMSKTSIRIAQGTASSESCQAGFQLSPWDENELIDKIIQCMIILNHYKYSISKSRIFKLLGLDKNSIYRKNENEYKISELINDIFHAQYVYSRSQDPAFTEHMHSTKSSINVGSGITFDTTLFNQTISSLHLTPNQGIYAAAILPIFNKKINFPIKIGLNQNEFAPHTLMTLVLLIALLKNDWFYPNMKLENLFTYAHHLNNFIQQVISSGRVHSQNTSLDYLYRKDRRYSFLQLIGRIGAYRVGYRSFEYKATSTLLDILKDAIDVFNHLELELVKESPKSSDIIVTPKMAQAIEPRDFFILLNHLKGSNSEGDYVIDNTSTITDRQNSRVYSLMTSLRSRTRTQLGFIN